MKCYVLSMNHGGFWGGLFGERFEGSFGDEGFGLM